MSSHLGEGFSAATVQQLMYPGELRWNEEIIGDVFNSKDSEQILHIPLSLKQINDNWYWQLKRRGIHTVKSGYRSQQGELQDAQSCLWSKLWKLNIPPEVINFMWRTLQRVLPTADKLWQ